MTQELNQNQQQEVQNNNGQVIQLDEVAVMVVAGYKKNGEVFTALVGTNDLLLAKGLVHYVNTELDMEINRHIALSKAAQQQSQASDAQ